MFTNSKINICIIKAKKEKFIYAAFAKAVCTSIRIWEISNK